MIVPVNINKEMKLRAEGLSRTQGVLKNSILEGKGNFTGYLGEELFLSYYGGQRINGYNYDILYDNNKIEVKTKKTSVPPRSHYSCSLANYNTHQETDYYVFCRVNAEKDIGWICGSYPAKKYITDATFLKKGQVDPDNNYTVKADCWNLPISKLIDLKSLHL